MCKEWTEEHKKFVLDNFLEIIWGISNQEYQKRVWVEGKGPEVDDFTETSCCLDDMGFIPNNYEVFGITKTQYSLLKNFLDRFDEFPLDTQWPPDFIDTPEWAGIMTLAKEVLDAFGFQKKIDLLALMEFTEYFDYFRNGALHEIDTYNGQIIITIESSKITDKALAKKVPLTKNGTWVGRLWLEGVELSEGIKLNDSSTPNEISFKDATIKELSIQSATITLDLVNQQKGAPLQKFVIKIPECQEYPNQSYWGSCPSLEVALGKQ